MPNEEKRLPGPTVITPPQPPEYFPGFAKEFESLGVAGYAAQKRLGEAERKKTGLERIRPFPLIRSVFGVTNPVVIRQEEEFQLAMQEFDLALQEVESIRWRQEVMVTLPDYLSMPDYKIQSAKDALNFIPNSNVRYEDTIWLEGVYERLKHLSNVLPEGFDGDAIEAQTKVLNEILTAPKLELRAVHNLTVDEIAKSFQFGVAELPAGMNEEDVRNILSEMDLAKEEMRSAKAWLDERAKAWREETARLNLIRSGLVLAEAPELTPVEFLKLTFTQPMMATVELLEKYWSILPRPISAAVIANLPPFAAGAAHGILPGLLTGFIGGAVVGAIGGPVGAAGGAVIGGILGALGIGTVFQFVDPEGRKQDITESFDYYRSMGETGWASYSKAFNAWDAPWWQKMILETSFDPTMVIGFGVATATATKIGYGLTKLGLRGLGTRIGPWIGAVESGYVAGADAVFKAGVQVVLSPIKGAFWLTTKEYAIPKTLTFMARNFARKSIMDFNAVLGRTFPEVRNLKGLTVKDITDTAENVIKQAIERPTEGHDLAVRAGANLLEFGYLDDAAARGIVRGVVADATFDTSRLAHFNNEVLNMFSGQGERVTAGKILADLGQEATEETVAKLSTKLTALREKVAKNAVAAVKGDTADKAILSIFNRLEEVRYSNLQSPLTSHFVQAGRSASWVSRVADRVLQSSGLVALERRLVMPVARWNLLFMNFGPYNFAENMQRSFLGGAEILYPKSYSGIAETNRLFKGLSNAPYELQMMERGLEVRLAQAMVDPKTGRTALFKGGKIPFVTRDVTIPEKVPLFGGKTIGKKINIAGRDHYLASFQDQYDMWAHFNGMQVAYDYQVHYMKALAELSPDDMRGLVEVVSKHKAKIDSIGAITSKDARDIERVLLQDATVGPDDVRAHSKIDVLEFERRQISKELGKTLDKCTEVRSITKKGIIDEVLDGSIFSDVDGRIAAWIERERELSLISLKNQMDVLTKEAESFAANPPKNMTEFLGDMENITSMLEGTSERIHDYRKLVELRKAKLDPADFDDFEVGSAKLLAEFMETSEEQLTKIMNQLGEHAKALQTGGVIDWSGIEFSRQIPADLQSSIRGWVDNLPIDIKIGIKSIKFNPKARYAYGGRVPQGAFYDRETRSITFTSLKEVRDPTTLYHELGHGAMSDIIDAGDREFVDRFANAIDKTIDWADVDSVAARIGEPVESVFYRHNTGVAEKFSDMFSTYIAEPTKVPVPVRNLLTEKFPKRVDKAFNETQLARLADLDSVSRLELENILAIRNKIAEVEAIIPRTAKKARNERFWQQQRAQKTVIWDDYDKNARKFKDLRLRTSRNFLNSVNKSAFTPDFIPDVTGQLTPNHLAYLYGVTGDDLYRGLTRVQHHATIRPREDFILHTREAADAYAAKFAKTADDIGFTEEGIGEVYDQLWHNLGVEPSILTPDSPTVMQMEEIRQELTRLHAANKIPESDVVKYRQYINSVADDVEKLPMYKEGAGTADWYATKESAMTKARELHALAYPTYDDANIIDESMRAIFPFWNYEMFRWRWIPRTMMRTPGTMTGVARWMEYSDQGYVPVPGTDLQLNPLRGSIWMGGLRSMYLRDFPEYYDKFPGMEFLDYIGRAGFFPGIHVMLPIALFGKEQGRTQTAELAPPFIRGTFSALRQISPEHIGKVLDIIYPDRFRDYMTMLTLGEEGYDADLIWRKKQSGEKITPEEEKLWLKAEARVDGIKGILMQQTGLFRIRPDEYTQLRQEMRLAIEESTGVPVAVQEQIDRRYPVTGKRFSDYYKLDILQQKLLYEFETYRRWQGVSASLYPAGWQDLDIKTRDYYEDVEKVYENARYTGTYEDGKLVRPSMVEINRQLVTGEIGPDQWKVQRSDIQGNLAEAVRVLGESPAYKDVPKTFEERAKMLEERNIVTPTQTPDQELLYYYYELQPEYKYDWEAQRMERDFDTYYAHIDILLESLDSAHRERFLQRIQSEWTPMELLYWQTSREYLKPYKNLRTVVLNEYTPEQVQQIRRYEVARGTEREDIQNIIGPDGDKLIAGFARRLREARQRLRLLDPDLDAWLNFWGQTDTLMSKKAEEVYEGLRKQYLTKAMIK